MLPPGIATRERSSVKLRLRGPSIACELLFLLIGDGVSFMSSLSGCGLLVVRQGGNQLRVVVV